MSSFLQQHIQLFLKQPTLIVTLRGNRLFQTTDRVHLSTQPSRLPHAAEYSTRTRQRGCIQLMIKAHSLQHSHSPGKDGRVYLLRGLAYLKQSSVPAAVIGQPPRPADTRRRIIGKHDLIEVPARGFVATPSAWV